MLDHPIEVMEAEDEVTKQDWEAIARALSESRAKAAGSWPPKGGVRMDAADAHDRKLIMHATVDGIDKAAHAVAMVLKSRSSRFDQTRFLRMVATDKKNRVG
jgi:hypothetical protein